jgi:Putative beta-barrel porin-2, OmpL-like. bbp2
MRSQWTVLAAAAATLWVVPTLAVAGDVEDQLQQMSKRMEQMEQQLQATNEELAASKQRVEEQQGLIQNLDEDRQASSGLSKFLSETEFSGVVAASYTYNFKNYDSSTVGRNGSSTTGGENLGLFGITAPQHSNSNNFQVDQLAIRMKKTPTAESRAGWGASLTWGASADALSGTSSPSGDVPELTEAYASYLFDIGDGVNLTAGRYMTPVGAESFFVNENFNITRGLLWSIQPVNHTGGFLGGDCECGLSWQLGASNGYGNSMADTDTEPTFVGSLGYKMDTLGFKLNGVYGGNVDDLFGAFTTFGLVGNDPSSTGFADFHTGTERNSDKIGLLDAVLTWNPSDSLSTWVNFDYWWTSNNGGGASNASLSGINIWGIAGAGRYAITESTGFSLRYEYLAFNDICGDTGNGQSCTAADLMELTATLDHHLTDNLVVSAEARWDRGRSSEPFPSQMFLSSASGGPSTPGAYNFGADHQVLGLVQMRYDF